MSSESGASMITAAQAGDQWVQDELVAEYLPLVYNIVGRGCTACSGHSSGLIPAEELLIGLALVPPAALPIAPDRTDRAARTAVGLTARTTPRAARRHRLRPRRRMVLIAGGAVLATGAGVVTFSVGAPDRSREVVRSAEAPRTPDADPPVTPTSASPARGPVARAGWRTSASPTPATSPLGRPAPARGAAAPVRANGQSSYVRQVIALLNREREKHGCGPLRADSHLRTAAQRHSDDMAARGFFSHTNPDGTDPGRRITVTGYEWSTYGENIAVGQKSPEQVMKSWMDSPGHRANILNCAFKDVGIGIHFGPGGPWWTQNFGAGG
ncbi:CAP domain-containing protein [Streptomyces sannanensis]|uniref:CAP domain-containing protein n=1 Tax=Streptomyces sannanensis TaxID=285536 RepID=UPI0031F09864